MFTKTLEKSRRRAVRGFMGILVLVEMENRSLSCSDVIGFIHEKFDVLVSPRTVYSLMFSLERDGLIKGVKKSERVYTLTEKRERTAEAITKECLE